MKTHDTKQLYGLLLDSINCYLKLLDKKLHKDMRKILQNDVKEIKMVLKDLKGQTEPFVHMLACMHVFQAEACLRQNLKTSTLL
jgi:hypothetical protein